MALTLCPLYSGSSGNSLLVATEKSRVLIDAGLSGKAIITALEAVGVDPSTLSAILVTHEHSDHIKGAGILSRRFDIPIFASKGTWPAMERSLGAIAPMNIRTFDAKEDFFVKEIGVVPFSIPHDAADPVGFRLFSGGFSVSVATDLGYYSPHVHQMISGSDIVLLESNHDENMLLANVKYTHQLKRRILGRKGHLSNESCAQAALSLYKSGVNHIILGHLSGENNLPELAYEVTRQTLAQEGIIIGQDVGLDVAPRHQANQIYTVAYKPNQYAVGI